MALRFERACSQQMAAKEMVFLAEQGFFKKGQPFDPAWQEMLNHATMKVGYVFSPMRKFKIFCTVFHNNRRLKGSFTILFSSRKSPEIEPHVKDKFLSVL